MSSEDTNIQDTGQTITVDTSNIDILSNPKNDCPFCGKTYKGLRIHISKAHPSEYRSILADKVVTPTAPVNESSNVQVHQSEVNRTESLSLYESKLKSWIDKFACDMDDIEFSNTVSEFVQFLANATDFLPGPKNPAAKYVNARKRNKLCNNNRQYGNSSNPQRSSKNERLRRRAKFDYQKTQYDFYYQRRKAVRRILHEPHTFPNDINIKNVEDHFRLIFETENHQKRESYEFQAKENNDITLLEVTADQIFSTMKRIAIDTSPGPDKVLMKSIRNPTAASIIAHITNRMIKTGFVPSVFTEARTILLHKDGNDHNLDKWRPITISSVLRRVISKTLDSLI